MKTQPVIVATAETDHKRLRRLEYIMQDVLHGMEELATLRAWEFGSSCMEILAIEVPETPPAPAHHSRIIPFRKSHPAR